MMFGRKETINTEDSTVLMENNEEIKKLRKEIDKVDDAIVEQFLKRMDIAGKLSDSKKKNNFPAVDKTRERIIISRLSQGKSDEMAEYIKALYSAIFVLSRAHQMQGEESASDLTEKIRDFNNSATRADMVFPSHASVACHGDDGSYSQVACDRIYKMADIMSCLNYNGVMQAVSKGLCRFGLLPIENSLQGSIVEVYEMLKENDVHIVKSIQINIKHVILSKKDLKPEDIKEIFTYRHAVEECSEYVKSLKNVKIIICENTAEAAKMAASCQREGVVALSSPMCAPVYGLKVIAEDIQNTDNNYSRFVCIEKGLKYYEGANKISICVTLQHKSGALYELISKFAALSINITKIESRPVANRDFECEFYIDFEADLGDESVMSLLANIEKTSDRFYFLGCYSEV